MKIIIPTFEKIEWMPPTITLLNELAELGHEITYITIFPDEYSKNFNSEKIKNVSLCKKDITILKYFSKIPILSSICFRLDTVIKKIISKKLNRTLTCLLDNDSILWVVNEMTVLLAGSRFLKNHDFIFTIYELHPHKFATRHIQKAAQYAKLVVVPEYNRAHMQKLFFGIKKLPFVLPNKPSLHPRTPQMPLNSIETKEKIEKIKSQGKKILLYMGIIGEERPLDTLITAAKELNDQLELVILGRNSAYLQKLQRQHPNSFTYLGFVRPPDHLNIASHADIGILNYVGKNDKSGLNALYCAPNKIYEYTGFGMPIMCNNIPGLRYTVETYNCGICVDFENKHEIIKGLKYYLENHSEMSKNANLFYEHINIKNLIIDIVNDFKNRR